MKSVHTAKWLIMRTKSFCILIERGRFFTRLITTNCWHFDPGYVVWHQHHDGCQGRGSSTIH